MSEQAGNEIGAGGPVDGTPGASPRHVLANWAWLFSSQVLVRCVALGYKVFLARQLHAEGYGIYAWVLAVIALTGVLSEAGFNRLLIRDIAREPQRGPDLLGAVLRFRLWLAAGVYLCMLGLFALMPPGEVHMIGLLIAGLTLLVGAAGNTFDAAFYALEQARFSGISQILVTVVGAVLGAAAVLLGFGLPGLFASVAAAEVVRTGYLHNRLAHLGVRPQLRAAVPVGPLMRDALPYALLGVLGMVYFRIDTVMLSPLRGDVETGIYTVAFKIFEVLLFVPGTLAAVVLPRMARYHEDDGARLRASHLRLTRLLYGAAVPICAALWLGAPWIIRLLFGPEYAAAVPVLRVLAVAFGFYCLHTPNAAVVLSGNVLAPVVWLSVGTAAFNVVLNGIFIPRHGAAAAAATTLASEVLSWVVFTAFIHWRIQRLDGWWGAMARPTGALLAAGAVVAVLRAQPVVAVVAGCGVYAVACVAFGVVSREDVALLRRSSTNTPGLPPRRPGEPGGPAVDLG